MPRAQDTLLALAPWKPLAHALLRPDRTLARKDEEELELAVAQGLFDAATAVAIETDASDVEARIADWG